MNQTSVLQSSAEFSPSLDDRWRDAGNASARALRPGFAIALLLHALVLALMLAPSRESAGSSSLDGVTVELIDSDVFDRRKRVITGTGQDTVNAPPEGAGSEKTAERAEQQAKPAGEPSPPTDTPAPPEPTAKPSETKQPPPPKPEKPLEGHDLDVLATPLDSTFSVPPKRVVELDTKQSPFAKPPSTPGSKSAEQQLSAAERYLERRSRTATKVQGSPELDAYTKSTSLIVERSKPVSPGISGRVVVELIFTEAGRVNTLRVVQSSGKPRLDNIVLESLRRNQYLVPPPGTSLEDRTYELTYDYK